MVHISRRLVLLVLVALPLLAVAGAAAQSLPSLFIGTVKNESGQPIANASLQAQVGGQICSEGKSGPDGQYGLAIPDKTTRPAACSEPNQTVSIIVNGTLTETATLGKPGAPVQHDIKPGGTATPPKPDTLFTLAFNGSPSAGANGAAVVGGGVTAAQIQAESEKQSGRGVLAIWMFSDNSWKVFVPDLVAQFASVTPPVALYVVLS